jgi:hypothetical protein
MGFANKCPFCQSNNNSSHSDCSYAGKAFRGEPITNELLLEARRDMDLTAAFEELLKRKGRREGYQYRHRVSSTQRIHPEQLEAIKVRSKELTAMGQIKAASPLLLPSIPICRIVPTLHILLGIINDIVSPTVPSWQSI